MAHVSLTLKSWISFAAPCSLRDMREEQAQVEGGGHKADGRWLFVRISAGRQRLRVARGRGSRRDIIN